MTMGKNHGDLLREKVTNGNFLPFAGVYDVFSASLASRHFSGLFISGFSFGASYYGLPDIGFICWSDLLSLTQRIRTILPHHDLLVDVDDGFGDSEIACHVISQLEKAGASGIIIEDQKRPRRCGHFPGKQLLELPEFTSKLTRVLETRKTLFVVARTDATENQEREERAKAFSDCGADAVLLEALPNLETAEHIKGMINCPIMVNQIAGGTSPSWSFSDLQKNGILLVNYSTPCLFGAQHGIEQALINLMSNDGRFNKEEMTADQNPMECCNRLLYDNKKRRDMH